MITLSQIIQSEDNLDYPSYMLNIFETLGIDYAICKNQNELFEGVNPDSILVNDNWKEHIDLVEVVKSPPPHTDYIYYPSEYLRGKPWDSSCTVFALFSILYKLMTGQIPYVNHLPETMFNAEDSIKLLLKARKNQLLDLSLIPPSLRSMFSKGLSIPRKYRYKSIDAFIDDFMVLLPVALSETISHFTLESSQEPTPDQESDYEIDENLEQFEQQIDYFKQITSSQTEFFLPIQKDTEGSLDDLVGLHDLKHYLRHGVLAIMKNPEKAHKYKLAIPNGILLYGPPGCGKTTIAQKFAAECQMNYAIVNAQDIASTFVHGTQRLVKQLFQQAEQNAPIVLILDEIETMVPNRNDPNMAKMAEDTNAFLSEMNNCGERGIFLIGTTNRPQFMDSAILRSGRFDKRVYIPLPDEQTRKEIFHAYLAGRPIDKNVDCQRLSRLTSGGYISSDIRQICDEAAARAFHEDAIITQQLLEQVIRDGGPSVNKNELKTYEESRKHMEPTSHYTAHINQIGFR